MSTFRNVLGFGIRFAPEGEGGGGAATAPSPAPPSGGAAPAPGAGAPAAGSPSPTGGGAPGGGSAPAASPARPEPTTTLDFGGRRLPADAPGARELHGDWQNQQREMQRLRAELQQAQQRIAALAGLPPTGGDRAPGPAPAGEPDWNAIAEELETKLFQGGPEAVKFLRDIIRQEVMPVIQPIATYQQFNQQAAQLGAKYADFDTLQPEMDKVLEEQPHLAELPNALETVYWLAKGRTGGTPAAQSSGPDLTQLLADPKLVEQLAQSEAVRNAVLQVYLNNRTQLNASLPPTAPGPGTAPALPPQAPKTIREGTKAFLAAQGIATR